jgi:hypothetical protein
MNIDGLALLAGCAVWNVNREQRIIASGRAPLTPGLHATKI